MALPGSKTGEGFDIAAREADILGPPQRIAPLPEEELSEDARAICREMRKAFGIPENGVVPDSIRTMLRHPDLYQAQMAMGMFLAANGAIPARERELIVLRQAWLCGAPYEWGEHVMIGQRQGLTAEEIARVVDGPDASGWSARDRTILAAVDELMATVMLSDATWDALAENWNELQLMEFPILVGSYLATAMQQNALRMRLTDYNSGLTQR